MMFRNFFQKIKQPEIWQPLLIFFLISLVFCGGFLQPHFTTDTYSVIKQPTTQMVWWHIQNGRLFSAFAFGLARILHLDFHIASIISTFLAIIFLTFSLFSLYKLLNKYLINKKPLAFLTAILILVNPFLIELFIYAETSVMVLGILFCVLAAKTFAQYLEKQDKNSRHKELIKTIIFVTLATFCYQGIVGLFIVLATILVIDSSKSIKLFIKNTLVSVGCYAIGPIINLLFIRVFFHNARVGGDIIITESMQHLTNGAIKAAQMFDIIPAWCFWAPLIAIIIIATLIVLKKSGGKQAGLLMTKYLYIIIVIILASFAPQILQNSASVWVVPRSTYAFTTTIGIFLAISATQLKNFKSPKMRLGTYIIAMGYLFIVLMGFQKVIDGNYAVAAIDGIRSLTIAEKIQEYETEKDTTINKIMITADKNRTFSYPNIFIFGDVNLSVYSTDWSDIAGLNYYTNRNFEKVQSTSDWENYCKETDKTFTDGDEIVIDKDVAKICLY